MIETLEIYKDNQWHELDLLKPSGITIKFESPIIKGFDALTSDKSYSFTLPMTSKNALALGLSSDIRIEDNFSEKYECRYSFNGYSPKGKAYLYLSGVEGSLQANITFNIYTKLQEIKDADVKINELDEIGTTSFQEQNISYKSTTPNLLGQIVGIAGYFLDGDKDASSLDDKYGNYVDEDFEEMYNEFDPPEPDAPDAPDYPEPDFE